MLWKRRDGGFLYYEKPIVVPRYYQEFNERLGKWVKIDTETGLIVAVSKTGGEFEGIIKERPSDVLIAALRKRRVGFFELF